MSIERDETIAALRAEVADGRAEIHRLQTRCDMLDVSAEVRKAELAALAEARATITQLQARGTELVLERRGVDRRAQVREFFAAVGQAMPERPGVPDEASLRLGLRLIAEEVTEIFEAVFGQLPPSLSALFQDLIRLPLAVDLPDVIDGIVDAQYVLEGLAIRCGVDLRPVWTEDAK